MAASPRDKKELEQQAEEEKMTVKEFAERYRETREILENLRRQTALDQGVISDDEERNRLTALAQQAAERMFRNLNYPRGDRTVTSARLRIKFKSD